MNENMGYSLKHKIIDLNGNNLDGNNEFNIRAYHVNNESLSYAIDMHLIPLRNKWNPTLSV